MSNLSPHQFRYVHNTNAVLKPGDELRPSAEVGRTSAEHHSSVPGYDPGRVYFHDTKHPYGWDAVEAGVHGERSYVVEPVGRVEPDPEVEHLKSRYSSDPYWHEDHLGLALAARTAPRARVIGELPEDRGSQR